MNGLAFTSPFKFLSQLSRDAGAARAPRLETNRIGTAVPEDPEARHNAQNLRAIVEYEIIPRLMLAHSDGSEAAPGEPAELRINGDTVRYFAELTLTRDADALSAFVGRLVEREFTLEAVYMDLVVPAARLLGDFWNDDTVSYTDVTIGLGRLQQLIRTMGWQIPPGRDIPEGSSSALFAVTPGESHTLGLIIVEDQFRRAGWRTWLETAVDEPQLTHAVAHHWFDVIGFTLSNAAMASRLTSTITAVRRASRNRAVYVLVGGPPFLNKAVTPEDVGADATAANGADALTLTLNTVCHP